MTCAVFSVYGGAKRYEDEVGRSIFVLKRNNPAMYVYLVSDNPDLETELVDHFVLLDRTAAAAAPSRWMPRTAVLKHVTQTCHATLTMDSHVTSCSQHLRARMLELVAPPDFTVGTNVVHDTTPGWDASPFAYTGAKHRALPHNCAVLLKRGPRTQELLDVWMDKLLNQKDDQKALRLALDALPDVKHTVLPERFIMAFKPLERALLGPFPRITFVVGLGKVDLVHSYSRIHVPRPFEDICPFVNNDTAPRLFFHASGTAQYQTVWGVGECFSTVGTFDPHFCDANRAAFAAPSPAADCSNSSKCTLRGRQRRAR